MRKFLYWLIVARAGINGCSCDDHHQLERNNPFVSVIPVYSLPLIPAKLFLWFVNLNLS